MRPSPGLLLFKGSLRRVGGQLSANVSAPQRHEAYLQVGELAESLGADIALILNLAILLLKWVGKCLVAGHVSFVFNEIHGFITAGGCHHR